MTPPTTPPADLDFASIRQQYPAAYETWLAWRLKIKPEQVRHSLEGVPDHIIVAANQYLVGNPRDLFDFFDQKGVYIRVQFTWYSIFKQPTEWYGEIEMNGVNEIIPTSAYPTRTAAESAAFMAAFGKLEDRLKQEQG